VPPKLRKAPGVVLLGMSVGPEIIVTSCPAFFSKLGTCDFHWAVYLVSTDSKSTTKILAIFRNCFVVYQIVYFASYDIFQIYDIVRIYTNLVRRI